MVVFVDLAVTPSLVRLSFGRLICVRLFLLRPEEVSNEIHVCAEHIPCSAISATSF